MRLCNLVLGEVSPLALHIRRQRVRHRQHVTAYPRACLVRGHVVVVVNHRDRTMEFITGTPLGLTQAAHNCKPASKICEKSVGCSGELQGSDYGN